MDGQCYSLYFKKSHNIVLFIDGGHEMEMDYEKEYAQGKALKAMDKQIPLKPKNACVKAGLHGANCSVCNALVFKPHKYCHECGQRLDWTGEVRNED